MIDMIGIYSITNKINGKQYIGQSVNIKKRWNHHKSDLKNNKHDNKHLQNAWNKYGQNNFEFKVIEECNKDLLNNKEVYWINKLNSYYNGYNNTQGGEDNPMNYPEYRKKVSQPGEKNGMYNKGYLVSGSKNGMYKKKHNKESRIKMIMGKKNINNSGIMNVSIRKDGCNLYRYYDENSIRHTISSMDIHNLKEKVLNKGLPWEIIDKEKANLTLLNRNHQYKKYNLWNPNYCSYHKTMMYKNKNNGYNPRKCFVYRYKNYTLPIGYQLDFISCEIINDLIKEGLNE